MVFTKKVSGIEFYKNNDANGGAMSAAIAKCPSDQIVILSETKTYGKMWGAVSPETFLNLIKTNRGMYEVIHQFPHKVYFDIDKKTACDSGFLPFIKSVILENFPNAEMAVSGSITDAKTSYHIVLQNYVIRNEAEREYMKHTLTHLSRTVDEAFDWKVYTKNRNMKIINQSKPDGRVQAIIENDDFRAHCITCFVNEAIALPFAPMSVHVAEVQAIAKASTKFDLSSLPKMKLTMPDDVDFTTIEPLQVLSLLPLSAANDHAYTHMTARFAFGSGISYEQFMAWMQHKHPTITSEINKRWMGHWASLYKFPPFDMGRMKTVLATFYPDLKKDMFYRKFAKSFEFDQSLVRKIDTISQAEFKRPDKYAVFNVGMGGGKTAQTVAFLKPVLRFRDEDHAPDLITKSFCWIAPNKALAHNTFHRLETDGVPCEYYLKYNAKEKDAGALRKPQSLVIVANSLHYVTEEKQYDIVVIDEIETLVDKWFGTFMQHKARNWAVFMNIIRKAKKVILLDAFITTKTLNLIRSMDPTASMCIFERNNEKTNRTVNYVSSVPLMHKSIIDDLNNGLKLFIFYPMKKKSNSNAEAIAMRSLYDMIVDQTGKKGVFYNADIDEEIKQGLKNVNEAWGDNNFIITNTMITCGVNYDNEDFDKEYLFIGSFNSPRDVIQVSYRPRHLTSGLINVCYLGNMRQTNTWEVDTKDMNCPIYTGMTESILVEKKSPIKRTFQLFCVKAHYAQQVDATKLSAEIEKEVREMSLKYDMGYKYTDIPDIDYMEANELQQKMFDSSATMMDKISLQKYFYKEKFIEGSEKEMYEDPYADEPVSVLEYGWDNAYGFMFTQMERLMSKPDNVFAQIQASNALTSMFPTNMKKVKLSPEILTQVFAEFKFKYVTKDSAATKLCLEVYNSFFGTSIIDAFPDQNKHVVYSCNTVKWDFFMAFVNSHSKRNPENNESVCLIEDDEACQMPDIL